MQGRRAAQHAGTAGQGPVSFDFKSAAAEALEGVVVGDTLDLHEVTATVTVARVEQQVDDVVLVGQQKKSLGIHVETADREDCLWQAEFSECPLVRFVRVLVELAENAEGLVKSEKHACKQYPGLGALQWQDPRTLRFFTCAFAG